MKREFVISAALLLTVFVAQAETSLVAARSDGGTDLWYVSNVRTLTFADGQLCVNKTDGTTEKIDISSVKRLTFNGADGSVGDVLQGGSMRVYPNPATDVLYVDNAEAGAPVAVYGLDGRRWLTGVAGEPLSVGALPSGFYVVKVGNQSFKIRKQ